MSQKICVISFDHWNYDFHIVDKLKFLNHNAHHIKIHGFKHGSLKDKITNSLSKLFLGKNLKKIRRQEHIINQLDAFGYQEQILVINPEVIDLKFHLEIKKRCSKYIAYLYDSTKRHPVNHLLNGIFDDIYSFDKEDIKNFGFKETSNYIYLPKTEISTKNTYEAVFVGSYDDRFPKLLELAKKLKAKNINYKFKIIGKSKHINPLINQYSEFIDFDTKKLNQNELIKFYNSSKVIVDLIRDKQTGLSFRFFEALALNKKIITNNFNVKNYSFYNPKNITFTNSISDDFFTLDYQPIPEDVYYKYTLENWVKTIFNI